MRFFVSLMYTLTWSANKDIFTSSLPMCFHIISFNCLIDLGSTSNNILNRDVESKQIFLFLFLVKKMLVVSRHCFGLAVINFFVLSYPFYHELVVDCVKVLFLQPMTWL